MSTIQIKCDHRKLKVLADITAKVAKVDRVLIDSIDVDENKVTIVGKSLNSLSFYLMDYTFHLGPNNTHMFIEIKKG